MPTRTPDPSPAQVLDNLKYCTIRAGRVQQEIVDRLEAALPSAIDLWNTTEGRDEFSSVKRPKFFAPAPADITGDYVNCILVAISVQTSSLAAGGVKQHDAAVTIYSVGEQWTPGDKHIMRRIWERAELCQGVLKAFETCCSDADGINHWRYLSPQGAIAQPEGYGNGYAVVEIPYTLKAVPRANGR